MKKKINAQIYPLFFFHFQTRFKVWEKARSVDRFADSNKYGIATVNPQQNSRGIFSSANTGSVNLAKSRFERKSSTPSTPLLGPRQKSATPFRNTRTPSPPFSMQTSLRRRSPSPIKTGNVNKVKNRFETENNNLGTSYGAEKYQIAAAKELSSSHQHLSSLHQTLPKAFKTCTSPVITSSVNDTNSSLSDRNIISNIPTPIAGGSYSKSSLPNTMARNTGHSKPTNYRPLRSVGSHLTSTQNSFSLAQRPPLSGIQESTLQGTSGNNPNPAMISSTTRHRNSCSESNTKQDKIVSPELSPSLSSSRGSQISSQNRSTTNSSTKRPTITGSIPSRFMNQDVINDAAYFISQKLSNVTPSPPTRNRNLSAGSIPSSTTSSTTSPHLSHTPKHIRGPFGYTDL